MANIIRFARMQENPLILSNVARIDEREEIIVEPVDTSVADNMIAMARKEAATIIAEAQTAAKETIEESIREGKQQVEQIKQQAYEEGYQNGYQEGHVQGKQAGLDETQLLINDTVEKTHRILTAGEKDYKEMILAAERQIIEIALAVAARILACQIEENPMVVLPVVKKALEKVRDQEQIVLRVGVDDFDIVIEAKQDFQNVVGRDQALTIAIDRTIERGSCVIDTSYGLVDAKIDTQFDAIKEALQGVLP